MNAPTVMATAYGTPAPSCRVARAKPGANGSGTVFLAARTITASAPPASAVPMRKLSAPEGPTHRITPGIIFASPPPMRLNEKRAKKYAQNLLKSIKIAKKNKKKIRIWFRVIPEYIDEKRFRKMMEKIGKVDEILLYQFLSRADWDRAVEGFEKPEISFVKRLKEVAEEYADRVIVVGDGER